MNYCSKIIVNSTYYKIIMYFLGIFKHFKAIKRGKCGLKIDKDFKFGYKRVDVGLVKHDNFLW